MTTTTGPALTTTMGVIHRVHGDTTDLGTTAEPAGASRLTELDVAVLFVPHVTDGCAAVLVNQAHLTRREPNLAPVALFGEQRGTRAGGTTQLSPGTNLDLD